MLSAKELLLNARKAGKVIPEFSASYFLMMQPVLKAFRKMRSVALISISRVDQERFEAVGNMRGALAVLRTCPICAESTQTGVCPDSALITAP